MDVHFFATLLASRYSKGEKEFDTSIFIVGGKTYAESQVHSATKRATKPGTR
jgi:CO dehydrogenase/acetyl-CoA synthase epsilon subunit